MVSIRDARIEDVAGLQDLNEKAFSNNIKYDSDFNNDWSHSDFAKDYYTKTIEDPQSACFIAEDDGKMIGYASGSTKFAPWWKSKYFEIDNIGVIPEMRKKGVGSDLMDKCFEWAKAHGFQKIYLNSYFKNETALEFYRNKGFTEVDISLEKDL